MMTGVYAARNIMGLSHHDVWAVNTEKEYHEEGRMALPSAGDRMVPTQVQGAVDESLSGQEAIIQIVFAKLDPVALGVAVGVVTGLAIFAATAILLLKGGPVIGPRLSLLGHFLFGFNMTWGGALIGCLEGSLMGFSIGYAGAFIRNGSLRTYAKFRRWREETDRRRHLLDKV